MLLKSLLCFTACIAPALSIAAPHESAEARRPPNIVYILADDMGMGDVSAYNPDAAWRTPNIDRLAQEGRRFTDAHSTAAVCTPSRYSLLTGRYSWRTRLKAGVLFGFSKPLIEPGRTTVPSFLREQGYRTAMVGKWHLGFDWARRPDGSPAAAYETPPDQGARAVENNPQLAIGVDYATPFRNGPTSIGFDTFFGISASLDMEPYVWLGNDRVESLPVRRIERSPLPAMWRTGPIAADFAHADVQSRFTREALDYLEQQDATQPFFLYLAFASPHTPIVPSPESAGRTGSPYGDFCVQLDHDIGRILRRLEEKGLAENTLVIFTADNGCSPAANFAELKAIGHNPQPGLRGAKADIFEGGHRVPFIARWPGRIPADTVSDALLGQIDLLATCAQLLGASLPSEAAEDSVAALALFTGPDDARVRDSLVHHSVRGAMALREGDWKLVLGPDSGGWSTPMPGETPPDAPPFQLFNLARDLGETTNVAGEHPEMVQRLGTQLKAEILRGKSSTDKVEWPQVAWMTKFGRTN